MRPAGRLLVAVVGPEADVTVGGGAAACVVAEVAVRAGDEAADRLVGDPAGARFAGGAGTPAVVAVVDVASVVTVDGLGEGAGAAVEDVVGSAGATAAGPSVPPAPLQAEPAKTRTAPRAARRRRT